METPPRAWGRPGPPDEYNSRPGKHPHERGEDWLTGVKSHKDEGNTPTSVGKTKRGDFCKLWKWKHPHERGEDKKDRK